MSWIKIRALHVSNMLRIVPPSQSSNLYSPRILTQFDVKVRGKIREGATMVASGTRIVRYGCISLSSILPRMLHSQSHSQS